MVTIDIGLLATILGVLGTLGGAATAVFRLMHRFRRMEEKMECSSRTHRVLMEGLYACLDGLHQQGCNGEVTKARSTLHEHLFRSVDP